jgi:Ca2+-binding RTX toxin-like protein
LNEALYADDDLFVGGTEADTFEGLGDNDTFDMQIGNTGEDGDQLYGGDGNDKFLFGAVYDNTQVSIDGGTGKDTLVLAGDYPDVFLNNMQSVERVQLTDGFDYTIDMAGDLGQKFIIDGSDLGALHSVAADGALMPSITLIGGAGDDDLRGSNGKDVLTGGGGQDYMFGRNGNDVYVFNAVSESTGANFDTIDFFSCHKADKIDLPFVVNGSSDDEHFFIAVLDHASFDDDMEAGMPALEAFNFARVSALSGDYAGRLFIDIDANGVTGYQGGQDMVIAFDNPEQLERFGPEDFTSG